MKSTILSFAILTLLVAASGNLYSQQFIIDPSTDGGFEDTHGWTLLNTSNVNKWVIGTATTSVGTKSAYISNDNSANAVTNPQASNSKIYLYKDVIVPLNANSISLSFKYKNAGTSTPAPRCMFALAASFPSLPTDGRSQLVGAEFLTFLNNHSGWTTYTNADPLNTDRPLTYQSQPLIPGATYRVLFEWSAADQTSIVQQPPICTLPSSGSINGNFTITPNTTETYIAVATGGSNFNYTWNVTGGAVISSGQGTSSVNVFFPSGYTSGRIQLTMSCPTPVYVTNGTTSGPLAIDEVSLSYQAVPVITGFSPLTAAAGANVTLSGNYFGATGSDNIVYLGGMKCTIVSASSTSITVQVPKHVNAGAFTVINTSNNLSSTYTYPLSVTNSALVGLKYYKAESTNASSSFEAPVTYTMSSIPSGYSPKFVLADIDNDGKLDVATYTAAGLPQVYLNTATAGLINAGSLSLTSVSGVSPASQTVNNVFAFDMNNDGKIDLGASNGTSTNGGYVNINSSTSGSVSFNNYSSILSATNEYKVSAGFIPADINLDGRPDIFGVNGASALTYYSKNTTSGNSFAVSTGNTTNSGSYNQGLTVSGTYYGSASGDLNNDGKPDVVLGKTSGGINVLQNITTQGAPVSQSFKYREAQSFTAGTQSVYSLKLADFDGDGKPDIVAGNSGATNTNIFVFRNLTPDGDGISFGSVQNFVVSFTSLNYPYAVAVGDMNSDGKPDIIVSNNSTGLGYFENTSSSGTISFDAFQWIYRTGAYAYLEIADIDGDNKPDIIASGASNTLTVFRNRQGEAGVVSADQTICSGTTPAAFNSVSDATLPSGTPVYLWQYSTTLDSWTNAAGTNNASGYTPTGTISTTTYYRRRVNSTDAASTYYYSNILKVTVTAVPGVPSGTGATGYGASSVTLSATPSGTNTVQWFTASSGGTAIASGNTYTTAVLGSTTAYYAGSLTSNGCPSTSRTSVTATIVTAAPSAPTVTAASRCDEGQLTLSATSANSQEIKWYDASSGGNLLYTGSSYLTPTLSTTTTYYVEGSNANGASTSRTACTATINRTPSILSVTGGAGCKNTAVVLSAQNDGTGTYKWYNDSTTTSTTGTSQTLSVSVSTTDITRYVSSINGTCEGPRVKVVASLLAQPAALSASSVTLCGNMPATITLTPPSNSSIAWYSASSGGILHGNGLSYTTPALSTTTTYYALLSDSNGCPAATRSAHTVTYTGPTVGVISNVNAYPLSSNNTFTASGMANYTSYIWQRSTDGINFTDISVSLDPGTTYSGFSGTSGATASLVISTTQMSMNGYKYRLKVVQSGGCEIMSNTATYYVAEKFGSCSTTTRLTPTAHSSYSPIQQQWFQCDNYGSCSSYGYNYFFGTLNDNSNSTGLIVGPDGSGNAYITLDFGSSQLIDQVYLQGFQSVGWDPNIYMYICGSDYGFDGGQILVSNDQVNWTTVVDYISNTDFQCSSNPDWSRGSNRFSFPAISARYVRAIRSGWQTSGLTEFYAYPVNTSGAPYIQKLPPSRLSIGTGGILDLAVLATPTTGSLSYAWSKSPDNTVYSALTDAGTITGSATNNITVTNFAAGNAGYYKLIATQGSCNVTATVKVELVAPYYSSNAGSGTLQTLSSWNTNSSGTGGSAPTDFGNNKIFILANSVSGNYTFTSNWTLDGILRLNNNKLTLGNYSATIDTIQEGSVNGYVQFTGTGSLISNVNTAGKIYPVGAGSYSPLTIINNTGTEDNFAVKINANVLQNGSSGAAMNNVVNRTWTITKVNNTSVNAGYGVDLKFEWTGAAVSGLVGEPAVYVYVSGTGWVLQTGTTVSRSATSVTLSGYKGTLNGTLFMVSNMMPSITSISPVSTGTGNMVTITGLNFKDASAVQFGGVNASSYTSNSGALNFDGTNDYVSVADANIIDLTTNYSLECWVKFNAFSSGESILSKQIAGGASGYYLGLTTTSPYTGIKFDGLSSANGLFETGQWYHIAVTKASTTRKLYVNGIEVALSGTAIGSVANTTALTFGYNPIANTYLNGTLDEVRLWNTVRAKSDILLNMNGEIATNSTGLVAYYRFNSLSSTSLTDGVTSPKNGTLNNFALTGSASNWVEGIYSATQISAFVGAGATGDVTVTTPGGTATYSSFTYINTPVIEYFTPTKTNRGTAVGIYGQHFTGATLVSFGGTNAASFTVVSDTEIHASVAAGTSGNVIVVTAGGSDTLAGFIYGVPYNSINVLAAWNKRNVSSAGFPVSADNTNSGIVISAQHSYSGLTAVNTANNGWTSSNSSSSLDIGTAPYISYSIQTSKPVKIDRVVIPGLQLTSGKLQLRWSVDGYATSLGEFTGGVTPSAQLTSVNLAGQSTQPAGTVEFRIYFYNAAETDYLSGGTGNTTYDGTVPATYDANYALAVYGSVKPEPTISSLADVYKSVGDVPFLLGAPQSNSTGTFVFSVANSAIATLSGNRVTVVSNGNTGYSLVQQESADYDSVLLTANIYVNTAPALMMANMHKALGSGTFTVRPQTLSSGSLSYTSGTIATATIADSTVTLLAAGSTVITASQAAEGSYNSATTTAVLTVGASNLANPTMTWVPVISKQLGNGTFGIVNSPYTHTSNSGGAQTFNSGNTNVATLSSSTATIRAAGVSILTVTRAATGSYNAASISTALIVTDAALLNPVISTFPDITKTMGDADFTISAPTSTSNGAISYFSTNPAVAVVSGNTVTLTGEGRCNIVAVQQATGSYNAGSIACQLDVLPSFTYATPVTLVRNTVATTFGPVRNGGSQASYSIAPALPIGLTFNTTTGYVTGTPTVASAAKTYTVTGSINSGSNTSTASFILSVTNIAPSGLSYTPASNTYIVGTTISNLVPAVSGDVSAYSVSPVLPDGLVIDQLTGIISGTPAVAMAATSFTVVASNESGATATTTISITVNDLPISGLVYPSPNVLSKGVAISPMIPSTRGGTVVAFSISPSLPSGLSIDANTGVISGTPAMPMVTMATYTVTATNTANSLTADVELLINDAAPVDLDYPSPNVFYKDQAITDISPAFTGGNPTSYSVSPALPAGLILNTSTGIISGTPTVLSNATDYSIVATNFLGYSEKIVSIEVVPPPPTVTTTAASFISAASASIGGDVTSGNGQTVTARGIVYSMIATVPVIGETDVTRLENGNGTGLFSSKLRGLALNTTYYYRAYASSNSGTGYGIVRTFTTSASCNAAAEATLAVDGDQVTVNMTTDTSFIAVTANCRLIGKLAGWGASPVSGTVNSKVWVHNSVPIYSGIPFVPRNYEITPVTNTASASATITLYFSQEEFDMFNLINTGADLPHSAADPDNLKLNARVYKYSGTSSNGSGAPETYGTTATIITPVLSWDSDMERWVVTFNVTGFSGFLLTSQITQTLPVKLKEFKGKELSSGNLLTWSTASETNAGQIHLEVSYDGSVFSKLVIIPAKGVASDYSYLDEKASGIRYYRLKFVDIDGKSSYSHIVKLVSHAAGQPELQVYPNPVHNKMQFTTTLTTATVKIYDMLGYVVLTRRWKTGEQVDISYLAGGTYFVELTGAEGIVRKKIVKY